MKTLLARGTCAAAVMAFGTVVFAQSTGQPQPPTGAPQTQTAAPSDQVTVTGCVQKEADYRAARNQGKGGVVGTGVGAGNEYVLIDATISPASAAAVGTTGSAAAAAATPTAFELTGENESQVGAFVGKRVEVIGKLKAAAVGPAGPTGGVTAGNPPTGVDVASKDLKLREVEVTSVKETTGTCPAK